ncbi:unnamed protein product [Mytilus edulis]|uniref:Uncharacterized protein n=1 Tax=Mytilus edulis TaxID=6550 RepID=A0A8S3USI3_MYTED|nr:unnamed protein product [Mytilus edulis]
MGGCQDPGAYITMLCYKMGGCQDPGAYITMLCYKMGGCQDPGAYITMLWYKMGGWQDPGAYITMLWYKMGGWQDPGSYITMLWYKMGGWQDPGAYITMLQCCDIGWVAVKIPVLTLQINEIMDREDRRRFFVIGSVFLEVVTPVFRRQIENNYTKAGFSCLQDFINNQPVVHTLFHLNHRYTWPCCVDSTNCIVRQKLPLYNYQWNLLYSENPGPGNHHCHCKYTSKPVKLDDLDITLSALILVNCFSQVPAEEQAIRTLRQYKNDFLSHNTNCGISEPKFNSCGQSLHIMSFNLTQTYNLVTLRILRTGHLMSNCANNTSYTL